MLKNIDVTAQITTHKAQNYVIHSQKYFKF